MNDLYALIPTLLLVAVVVGCRWIETLFQAMPKAPGDQVTWYKKPANAKKVIAFVHGFLGSRSETWGKYPEFIGEEFQDIAITIWGVPTGICRGSPPLYELGRLLKTRLELTLDEFDQIYLVAHSMGGVALQAALLELDDARSGLLSRVRYLVLFAVPNEGTPLARIVDLIPGCRSQARDLETNSQFIGEVRRRFFNRLHFPDIGSDYGVSQGRIPVRAVAGIEDSVVPHQSALSVYKDAKTVQGNHVTLKNPVSREDERYAIVRQVLDFNRLEVRPTEASASSRTFPVGIRFVPMYHSNSKVTDNLGKSTSAYRETLLSIQFFQHAMMIWRKDRWRIYALYRDPISWDGFEDFTGPEQEEIERLPFPENPPEGFYSPGGGFKRVWLKYGVEKKIGWAFDPLSYRDFAGAVQEFEHGLMVGPFPRTWKAGLFPPSQWVFVLYEKDDRRLYELFDY